MKIRMVSLLLGILILSTVPALAVSNCCNTEGQCVPGVCLNKSGKCNTKLCQKSLDCKICGCDKLCKKANCSKN